MILRYNFGQFVLCCQHKPHSNVIGKYYLDYKWKTDREHLAPLSIDATVIHMFMVIIRFYFLMHHFMIYSIVGTRTCVAI